MLLLLPSIVVLSLQDGLHNNPAYNVTPKELQTKVIFAISEGLTNYKVHNLCGNVDETDICRTYHIASQHKDGSGLDSLVTFKTFETSRDARYRSKALRDFPKYRSSYLLSVRPFPTSTSEHSVPPVDPVEEAALRKKLLENVEFSLCGIDRERSVFCRE